MGCHSACTRQGGSLSDRWDENQLNTSVHQRLPTGEDSTGRVALADACARRRAFIRMDHAARDHTRKFSLPNKYWASG